ncbi:MAG: SLC13 family permease [Solirubrobacteraceae bacterium]
MRESGQSLPRAAEFDAEAGAREAAPSERVAPQAAIAQHLTDAASQAWPPFVLVSGLLLLGVVAHAEGLFDRASAALNSVPGPPAVLLGASLTLVAATTAVLNLDTAVVFLTPVLVLAARRRNAPEQPFLYGAVFMANASSLYLPGSNLTNLLVLAREPVAGGSLLVPGAAASAVCGLGVWLLHRTELRAPPERVATRASAAGSGIGFGAAGALVAAAATLLLKSPAPWVLLVGAAAAAAAVARQKLSGREAFRAIGPLVLLALFLASVALGGLARALSFSPLTHAGRPATAALGAAASVLVNNLPAAVLLSAHRVAHPRALLFGLNLGPNLAVSGSLSAYLWWKAARQVKARPSVAAFTRSGVAIAPATIIAALLLSRG